MPSNQPLAASVGDRLISVVIPTYRGDRFIADALATVASQTWTNWEILVVEDGSEGETEAVVRRFALAHPGRRVEYRRHASNLSQSAARNTGIGAAHGEYIALLDVDDRWQPNHLSASMAVLEREHADLVYSTVAMFDDQSELVLGTWGPRQSELNNFPHSLMYRSFIVPSATVFRRDLVSRVGRFESEFSPCEDMEFWIRAAAAGAKFAYVKGCHVLYRKNHTGAETRGTCRMTEKYARVLDKHCQTFATPTLKFHKLVARSYFGAAWCHATTSREQDSTADPTRAPALLLRAAQLHRGNLRYRLHDLLARLSQRLGFDSLHRLHALWLRPRNFLRVGNLAAPAGN